MPVLTNSIGKNHFKRKVRGTKKTDISKILVCRPNQRLGNILLTTPLIQELESVFPSSEVDIIVKGGVANVVLEQYSSINNIIMLPKKPFKALFKYLKVFFSVVTKRYDLVINATYGSSSGKILTYLAKAKYKIFEPLEDEVSPEEAVHMAKQSIYTTRHYLEKIGYPKNVNKIPNLDLKLTESELLNGKSVLNQSVSNSSKKIISIFTFATGAKCYSKEWWEDFYSKLQERFGDTYLFLEILPIENVSQINFSAPTFYSKDVREIAAVMANTELFIGADSGIVHLASASKVTTIGLFSVTDENIYKPYNQNSVSVNTNFVSNTELVDLIAQKLADVNV